MGSMTAGVRATVTMVDRAVYRTDGDASVNLVYHSLQHGRPRRREENRTEFNCTQRKSEAEVTNNRRLRSTCCTCIEANY